jgi:hypothetical protein
MTVAEADANDDGILDDSTRASAVQLTNVQFYDMDANVARINRRWIKLFELKVVLLLRGGIYIAWERLKVL